MSARTGRAKDTVCIYSGGMDSYTLVGMTREEGRLHSCLSFDYGQRHAKELEYARENCAVWGIPHRVINLESLAPCLAGSALTMGAELPEGHYADDNMKLTVVPNRNMIMLSIAIAYAISNKLEEVRYGAHSGDHTIYPDCRPEFVHAMSNVAQLCDWWSVVVDAPFINLDKARILLIGHQIGLDYSRSWTCYAGREKACGKCGSCQERLEGFATIGRTDPLEYEA